MMNLIGSYYKNIDEVYDLMETYNLTEEETIKIGFDKELLETYRIKRAMNNVINKLQ